MKIRRQEFKEFFRTGYGIPVGSELNGQTNADWCREGGKECPRSKYTAMMKKKMKRK